MNKAAKIPVKKEPLTDFNRIFPLMTEEEQELLTRYMFCGMYDHQNNTMLMGQEAYDRLENYKEEMVQKYMYGKTD